jgi:hypothetical protein
MTTAAPLRRATAPVLPPTPAERKPPPAHRPRLVLVSPRRSTASRLPFLIVVGAIMVAGLVGVLLLHMLAAQDAYRANHLQQRLTTLTDAEQRLSRIVAGDSAPAALRQRAVALGMVPATIGGFHKLRDGRTVGLQAPVYQPPPSPTVTHSATPATKPTTGKQKATPGTTKKTATNKKASTTKPGKTTQASKPGNAAGSPGNKQTRGRATANPPASKHHHHTAQP